MAAGRLQQSPGLRVQRQAKPIKSRQWSDIISQELPEERKDLSAQGWSLLQNGCPRESGRAGQGRSSRAVLAQRGDRSRSLPGLCASPTPPRSHGSVGCMAVARQERRLPFPGAYLQRICCLLMKKQDEMLCALLS